MTRVCLQLHNERDDDGRMTRRLLMESDVRWSAGPAGGVTALSMTQAYTAVITAFGYHVAANVGARNSKRRSYSAVHAQPS